MDVEIAARLCCFSRASARFLQIGSGGFLSQPAADHYAEDVSNRSNLPAIPAEALARRSRLQAALRRMEAVSPNREPACLQALRARIEALSPTDLEMAIEAIRDAGLAEEAAERVRSLRLESEHPQVAKALALRLAPLAAAAQQRRAARWQLDTRRTLIRFTFAKEAGVLEFDDGELHALFLQAFRLEGLDLALDLGKRPRPLLTSGLPLAAGIGSRGETMDAVLKREPSEDPAELMARLNLRLPEGLRIERWMALPGYATAPSELARLAYWIWSVDPGLRPRVEAGMAAFLQADSWPWERGPAKSGTPPDLRRVISGMQWVDDGLHFETLMGPHQALNPIKLLGAVFGLEPSDISGVVRAGVDLDPDPRLGQADRFEPKLKNMYEDAVLLGGGSNIVLVDEDDDEPTILG